MTCVLPLFLQACSDKLQREMKEYGYPPIFPVPKDEEEEEEESGKQDGEQLPKDFTSRPKKVHAPVHTQTHIVTP